MTINQQDPADVVRALFRYELALPVLQALHTHPAMRYRDLVAALANDGEPVYSRTLANALRFLNNHKLVYRQHQPKATTYHITDLGRRLVSGLAGLAGLVDHYHDEPSV